MTRIGLGLLSGAAFTLCAFAGPDPRDATTHKPSPEQCAAAAAQGRTLVGCADAEVDSAAEGPPADRTPTPSTAPRDRFIVCPGNPRCPR